VSEGVHVHAGFVLGVLEGVRVPELRQRGIAVGDGTSIWHGVYIGEDCKIGKDCTIGQYVHIGARVVIHDRCKIQNGVQLFAGVTLHPDVFVGPHVVFTNVLTPRAFVDRRAEFKETHVGRGASIGANATIVCGVTIGEYAMVGAGAVVTRPVTPYALVIGSPARYERWVCKCGELLSSATPGIRASVRTCTRCAARYTMTATSLTPEG